MDTEKDAAGGSRQTLTTGSDFPLGNIWEQDQERRLLASLSSSREQAERNGLDLCREEYSTSYYQTIESAVDSESVRSRIFSVTDHVTTFTYEAEPPSPAFQFQFSHDQEKRLLVLTWPDGKTEQFRDNPIRQLVVQPDPDSATGEFARRSRTGSRCLFICAARNARWGD